MQWLQIKISPNNIGLGKRPQPGAAPGCHCLGGGGKIAKFKRGGGGGGGDSDTFLFSVFNKFSTHIS